jgi:hypothetical protein
VSTQIAGAQAAAQGRVPRAARPEVGCKARRALPPDRGAASLAAAAAASWLAAGAQASGFQCVGVLFHIRLLTAPPHCAIPLPCRGYPACDQQPDLCEA